MGRGGGWEASPMAYTPLYSLPSGSRGHAVREGGKAQGARGRLLDRPHTAQCSQLPGAVVAYAIPHCVSAMAAGIGGEGLPCSASDRLPQNSSLAGASPGERYAGGGGCSAAWQSHLAAQRISTLRRSSTSASAAVIPVRAIGASAGHGRGRKSHRAQWISPPGSPDSLRRFPRRRRSRSSRGELAV
jgi:hypothetical protein